MAFLWSLVVIDPLFILSTFLCGCVSIPLALIDKTGDSSMRVGRVWARSLLWITGVRVTVEGLEKIDLNRNYLFCSNHLSYMDTPVVLANIPAQFRFLAKKGLFQIPFLGTHLKQAGHIPVPLEDPRAAVKTMTTAAAVIQKRGISMLIFPEGGRSEDGVLQPFKEGGGVHRDQGGSPAAADCADRHARGVGDGLASVPPFPPGDAAHRRPDFNRRAHAARPWATHGSRSRADRRHAG